MAASQNGSAIRVDPQPRYDLSPWLYMQFMEPLGATDSSVDAAWNFLKDDWREDVVEVTKDLAPPLMRYGGCFSSYYRWKEGVGPRNRRKPASARRQAQVSPRGERSPALSTSPPFSVFEP